MEKLKFKPVKLCIYLTLALSSLNIYAAEIYNKDGNKINLNGRVEAVYAFRGIGDNYRDFDNEDKTIARLGFTGETQINSQLTGYAKLEQEFSHTGNQNTRYSYVGLKYAQYGSLDFGRSNGIVAFVRDITDKPARFGANGFGGGADKFMTGRASGMVTYSNIDTFGYVDGLDLYLQYQAKNYKDNGFQNAANGDGIAMTALYKHEGTGLGGGLTYSASDRLDNQRVGKLDNDGRISGTDGNKAEIWGAALKYDANKLYAAVSFAQSKNMFLVHGNKEFAPKTRGIEAVLLYEFANGFTPSIVYNHFKGQELRFNALRYTNGRETYDADINKFIAIGTKYKFSKQMDMAVAYKFNLLDDDSLFTQGAKLSSDDQIEMRLTYSF